MNRKLLFALLLLPGLAHAVICKTVGPDGVISFTNLPGSECPSGERVEAYVPPAPVAERAERLVTGAPGGQAEFAGYESIRIESPEDGATIRSNDGRVPVVVALKPGLQQFHFITVHLNGNVTQGPYGSKEVVLTNVDRGTHKLYVTVKDSKGKTLTRSKTISFTLQRAPTPLQFAITGDRLVGILRGGLPVEGEVTVRFPESGKQYTQEVPDIRAWEVPYEPGPGDSVIEVEASPLGGVRFKKTARIDDVKTQKPPDFGPTVPGDYTPAPPAGYQPVDPGDYTPAPPADYRSQGDGISTTPGQPNPAFTPNFTP